MRRRTSDLDWKRRSNQKKREKRCQEREWWTEYKKNNVRCSQCGESHPAVIDFHHINPEEKDRNPSGWMRMHGKKLFEELAKCIPLCSNCHRKLHRNRD